MRIFHVSPLYYPSVGGGEVHIKELSEGLASRGHDVTVLTWNIRSPWDMENFGGLPKRQMINGVRVVRFRPDGGPLGWALQKWLTVRGGYRSSALVFGKDGLELLSRKPLMLQLIPYLVSARPDIVASIIWEYSAAYYTYLARKLSRFTLVGFPLFHTAERWCSRSIYTRMLADCDAVVLNTLYEEKFVRDRASVRLEVAGVGIHPQAFNCRNGDEVRARHHLGMNPVVGFVGRQDPEKGVVKLLHAMRIVWEWNHEVRLVLAGTRLPRSNKVDATVEGLPECERQRIVRINDFPEEEKASIYDAFDVFALPSTAESFGISYLEAWMCGKPVIGARIGPTQCVINEGVDGLLVDPTDPDDIARAIIELLSDSHMRERMGRSGHAKTIAQFTWDRVTDNIEKLYLDLLASKVTKHLPASDSNPWSRGAS